MSSMFFGGNDPGLTAAARLDILEQGVIGYALLSSRDLQECLSRYLRYQHLLCPLLKAHLDVAEENACLSVRPIAGTWKLNPEGYRHFVQEWLAGWNRWGPLVRDCGPLFDCVELDFAAPSAVSIELYSGQLGCEVRFACSETRGIFPAELLCWPLAYSESEFRNEQGERLLQTLRSRPGLVAKVNRMLVTHIGPPPAMEAVADKLCMSVRTLHRHLQREETSYQQLVIDYRLALAKRYLAETSLSVNEIAGLVGYADTANFYRTFRSVEEVTPQQYRLGKSVDELGKMGVLKAAQGM